MKWVTYFYERNSINMKNKIIYILVSALFLLSLFFYILSLQILPDTIPLQYGIDNSITGWGSKNMLCIFLILEVMIIAIFIGTGYLYEKMNANENEVIKVKKSRHILNIICLVVLALENVLFMYTIFYSYYVTVLKHTDISISIMTLSCFLIGILFIFLGVLMRKTKKNYLVGIRNKSAMQSDITWKKAQNISSYIFVIGGCILIIMNIFIPESMKLCSLVLVPVLTIVICLVSCNMYIRHNR